MLDALGRGEKGWQTDRSGKDQSSKTKSGKGRKDICPEQSIIQVRPAFPWWRVGEVRCVGGSEGSEVK